MSIRMIQAALVFSTIIFQIFGCQPSEERIRELVREELAGAMQRTAILDAHTVGPYSPAVRIGNFLFVSGQIGINPETGIPANKDIETETRQALENLTAVLRKAGFDSSDVVSSTVYLKDMNDYIKMNLIYGGYFDEGNYPARATVGVASLPRNARIEISAVAYKSEHKHQSMKD